VSTPSYKLLKVDSNSESADVFWLAGEHSGDQHAALVAQELAQLHPELKQVAVGGAALEAAGLPLLHDLTERSVVGLVEVLKHYSYFKKLFAEVMDWIRDNPPKVLVLVDYPGFNLRLAEALFKEGLSQKAGGPVAIYYYIGPQVWAWKAKRRFKMAKLLGELGVILPFEVDTFADTDLKVNFVGHPFLAEGHEEPVTFDPEGDLLLLPGSRLQPIRRIYPAMLDAVEAWRKRNPAAASVTVSTLGANAALSNELRVLAVGRDFEVIILEKKEDIRARAVLTSSGTMSMHCALAGVPGAIVYRANYLTYLIGRRIIKIPYLGLSNLILGRTMYPEFIQGDADPNRLAEEMDACLGEERRDQAATDAMDLRKALSQPTSSSAARRISSFL
jgi:lipid-A-disaccharide synthase|tara:strand:- start:3999 stop:5165 length:1167 start_codon:yes stop_codon:yes gene_type:complete